MNLKWKTFFIIMSKKSYLVLTQIVLRVSLFLQFHVARDTFPSSFASTPSMLPQLLLLLLVSGSGSRNAGFFFFFGGKKVWTSFSLWAHRRELQRGNMTVSNRVRASCCRLTGCCWCLWRWQSFPAAAVRVKLNSWTTTTSWSVVQCLGDMTCVYENNYLKTEKVGRVGRGKHNVFPTVCVLVCVSACGAVSCWQTCRESLGVNYIINVCLMLDK